MKRLALVALVAITGSAFAGGNHDQPPPSNNPGSSSQSGSSSGALAGAVSGSSSGSKSSAGSSSGGNKLSTGPSSATGGKSNASGGAARQGQGQQQGQAATLTGGNSSASNGENVGNGQQTTSLGGTSYNDDSRTLFIPPVVPPTPASVVGIGNVVLTTTACGPLQTVVKTPIDATNYGIFRDAHQTQGVTYDLAPVVDVAGQPIEYRYEEQRNGDLRIIGSQSIIFATVVAVSSVQNLAIGGGGGSSWGQAGGGASGSMSQLVTNIQVHDCEVGFLRPVQAPVKQSVVRPVRRVHHARPCPH